MNGAGEMEKIQFLQIHDSISLFPTPNFTLNVIYYINWPTPSVCVSVSIDARSMLEIGYDADNWCGLYKYKSMWAITSVDADPDGVVLPLMFLKTVFISDVPWKK